MKTKEELKLALTDLIIDLEEADCVVVMNTIFKDGNGIVFCVGTNEEILFDQARLTHSILNKIEGLV